MSEDTSARATANSKPTPGPKRVVKLRPSASELGQGAMTSTVTCDVTGCGKELPHGSALRMHRIRHHKLIESEEDDRFFKAVSVNTTKQCYCPVSECKYNVDTYFDSLKKLKQHYLQVHGEKVFKCLKCLYSTATQHKLVRHEKTCGVRYTCSTCACPFATVQSLEKHCLQRKHNLPENFRSRLSPFKSDTPAVLTDAVSTASCSSGPTPSVVVINNYPVYNFIVPPSGKILPLTSQAGFRAIAPRKAAIEAGGRPADRSCVVPREMREPVELLLELSKEQVANSDIVPTIALTNKDPSGTSTVGIQVGKSPRQRGKMRNARGTQTTGDYILKNAMKLADIKVVRPSKGSQVSPRAKLPVSKKRTLNTSETQTQSSPPAKYPRNLVPPSGGALPTSTLQTLEARTYELLNELEQSLPESISTQTFESYLAGPTGLAGPCSLAGPSSLSQSGVSVLTAGHSAVLSDSTGIQTTIEGVDIDPIKLHMISSFDGDAFRSYDFNVLDDLHRDILALLRGFEFAIPRFDPNSGQTDHNTTTPVRGTVISGNVAQMWCGPFRKRITIERQTDNCGQYDLPKGIQTTR